jgi:hypothetical protein
MNEIPKAFYPALKRTWTLRWRYKELASKHAERMMMIG